MPRRANWRSWERDAAYPDAGGKDAPTSDVAQQSYANAAAEINAVEMIVQNIRKFETQYSRNYRTASARGLPAGNRQDLTNNSKGSNMADKSTKSEMAARGLQGKVLAGAQIGEVGRDDIDIFPERPETRAISSACSIPMIISVSVTDEHGRNKNLTFDKAQEFIERSQQIREDINLLNAECAS